jgi:hypothetical protein
VRKLPETDVGPVTGLAVWERPDPAQPWFLRVARLGTQSRWQAAADLALEWTRDEPGNADAWHQAGVALSRIDRIRMHCSPCDAHSTCRLHTLTYFSTPPLRCRVPAVRVKRKPSACNWRRQMRSLLRSSDRP